MAKKKSPQPPRELTPLERLGLRVSAMIQAPKAQIDRRVVIHLRNCTHLHTDLHCL